MYGRGYAGQYGAAQRGGPPAGDGCAQRLLRMGESLCCLSSCVIEGLFAAPLFL